MAASAAVRELPQDLWFEVLLNVAAEDVVKYRRLSKFHRNLIDSPVFRRKHSELPIKTTDRRHVIISEYKSDKKGGLGSFDHCVDFRSLNTIHKISPPIKKERDRYKNNELVGCCMGILCYKVEYLESLILWNPLTNRCRKISVKPTERRCNYVLGHDSVSDDLKILKFSTMETSTTFEIYSSKMNSWTERSAKGYSNTLMSGYNNPIFLEGSNSVHYIYVLYGKTYRDESKHFMVAYNFSTQEFNQFLLPKTKEPDGGLYPGKLLSLDSCLCLAMYPNKTYYMTNCLEVWRLKEYGIQGSWTRMFSIHHCIDDTWSYKLRPLVLLNSGSQLALFHPEHALYICDVGTLGIQTTNLKKQLDFGSLKIGKPTFFIYTPTFREP